MGGSIQWWCAAQGEAWSWSWQAYPGVWLVVALVFLVGRRLARFERRMPRSRTAAWVAGTLVLWAALDWPLGPLGASYLASIHMVQYLMAGLVAPALLLLGVPDGAWAALRGRSRAVRALRGLTNPLAAIVVFNVGMTFTHWPEVVDAFRVSQLGSFGLDVVWLACGLVFWWPLIAPVPERDYFHPVFRLGYLFLNAVMPTPPALMMFFSKTPLYAVYELAPPIRLTPVLWDQQLAGGLMKIGSTLVMAVAVIFVAREWYEHERRLEAATPAGQA